jgi:RNA polymerase sigma factor (sigma-70 family)
MPADFPQTSWSLIARAAAPETPEGRAALAALCERYWYPVYAFIRRCASADEARDLAQGFFTRLLEKNDLATVEPARARFRSWLLACLQHYLAKERARARAEKRGGGQPLESFDAALAERRYHNELAHMLTPERLYERRFALALLERVLEKLRDQYVRAGNERLFDALKGRLTGDAAELPYKDVAATLGMSVEAVKTAASRLYDRYEERLRAEVARTVVREDEVDDELRHLLLALEYKS